jgi:hypothetical protein
MLCIDEGLNLGAWYQNPILLLQCVSSSTFIFHQGLSTLMAAVNDGLSSWSCREESRQDYLKKRKQQKLDELRWVSFFPVVEQLEFPIVFLALTLSDMLSLWVVAVTGMSWWMKSTCLEDRS